MATLSETGMIEAITNAANGHAERLDSIDTTLKYLNGNAADLKGDVSKILSLLGSGG